MLNWKIIQQSTYLPDEAIYLQSMRARWRRLIAILLEKEQRFSDDFSKYSQIHYSGDTT